MKHVARRAAKLVHMTSVHCPFDVRIFHKECKTLAEAGYEVTLIAPHDKAEVVNGICIEPVTKNDSRRRRMTRTVWEVYRKALHNPAQIYHFHDPELLPVGVLLKLAGKCVIYDAHEHVADDVLIKYWIHPRMRGLISASSGAVEGLAARTLDAIIAATPTIAVRFPPSKRVLVQNFPMTGELVNGTELRYLEREPLALYLGSLTEVRGAREMIAAAHCLPRRLGAKLLLLGDITPSSLERELKDMPGWAQVEYLGFQGRSDVAHALARARVGLVVLHPVPSYLNSQPIKLFEYMSAGIPVIVSNFPAFRELIESVGCGLSVDPMNPGEIAEAVTWILDHPLEAEMMGKRGQAAVLSTYNWDSQAENLLDLYDRLLQ